MVKVVTEADSGMSGSRPKACRLLADKTVDVIVAGRRGRLGRRSTGLAWAPLAAAGCLVVVDHAELDDDLVRDITEVLTSFRAWLYGRRPARNRAEKALVCAAQGPGGWR